MNTPLRDVECQALNFQKSGKYIAAIELWKNIVQKNPEWERGYPYYYMADCYCRLKLFDDAENFYRMASKVAPEDEMFSTALESFIEARKSGVLG